MKDKKIVINEVGFEFDFFSEDKKIIGEIYAGIDNISPGPIKKVITDCFKMVYAEQLLGFSCNKYLVFIDDKIAKKFKGNSWASHAIQHFGIEIIVRNINEEDLKLLREERKVQQISNIYLGA